MLDVCEFRVARLESQEVLFLLWSVEVVFELHARHASHLDLSICQLLHKECSALVEASKKTVQMTAFG